MRIASHAQPIQNSGSKAFIDRKWSIPKMPGATSTARPARPCANRFTAEFARDQRRQGHLARPASAGNKRMAGSDSPSVIRTIQAITAISGGWST